MMTFLPSLPPPPDCLTADFLTTGMWTQTLCPGFPHTTPTLLLPNPPRSSGAVMQVSWPQGLLVDQGGAGKVRRPSPGRGGCWRPRLLGSEVGGGSQGFHVPRR